MTHAALAFLGVSAVVIVTPGQDTALTIRNALAGGRRSGVFTALGVATGQATWTIAAAGGIAALLRASEPLFVAVKLCGAAYLVFLGAQTLLGAWRRRPHAAQPATRRPTAWIRSHNSSETTHGATAIDTLQLDDRCRRRSSSGNGSLHFGSSSKSS